MLRIYLYGVPEQPSDETDEHALIEAQDQACDEAEHKTDDPCERVAC